MNQYIIKFCNKCFHLPHTMHVFSQQQKDTDFDEMERWLNENVSYYLVMCKLNFFSTFSLIMVLVIFDLLYIL